jgi:hypothetical protein
MQAKSLSGNFSAKVEVHKNVSEQVVGSNPARIEKHL